MMMNSKSAGRVCWLLSAVAGAGLLSMLAGCSTQRFYANYYLDPKPPHVSSSDFTTPDSPQPVYLVFDMYEGTSSFPEATRKLAPKVAQTVERSGLFSGVSKVGSENMARIQVSMRETAVLSGSDAHKLPEGLTSGMTGGKGAIVYQFNASYQAPGSQAPYKRTFLHAVHIVEGTPQALADASPMTASHAVDAMVEQAVLRFLRDLQREKKL
jgi:hypothetical protein